MDGNLASGLQGRVQTTCLVVLATLATGAALAWLRPVMLPFVLAVFIGINLLSDVLYKVLDPRAR